MVATRERGPHWRHASYAAASSPIIVGGCGRSGTTLMRVMLDTHRNICCGPESSLFAPSDPAKRLRDLSFKFDVPVGLIRGLLARSDSQAQFIDEFFGAYRSAQGKARWAEKSPVNVRYIGYIFEHFPDARFIHMIRDGRDVVCSLRNHPRYRLVNGRLEPTNVMNAMASCISRWVNDVRAGLLHRGDPRYSEVRYEDLVAAPGRTLRSVFQFLEEPWDPTVLDFHRVATRSRAVTKFPQNPEATEPIYASASGRWRRDMSASEAELFKDTAGHLLIELGYALYDSWLPSAERRQSLPDLGSTPAHG